MIGDYERLFSRAIVRAPGAGFAGGLSTARLGAPDHERALKQHALYCEALEAGGLELTRLEADERFPDSTFVEDTAVVIRQRPAHKQGLSFPTAQKPDAFADARASATCAILTRPGAPSRAGEVESIKEALSRYCRKIHSIDGSGTLDGGDICEADDHFFIGMSARTNEAGAQQLAGLLQYYGYASSIVDIRDTKSILHLKSGVAYLGDNRLVVVDTLRNHREFQGYELVRVNTDAAYAANCVRVNDRVFIAAGYPAFERTLRDLGYKTIALEMTEFQKMDGGLSCLSLRF